MTLKIQWYFWISQLSLIMTCSHVWIYSDDHIGCKLNLQYTHFKDDKFEIYVRWVSRQGGSLSCMLSCLYAFPQIHLRCDTFKRLDGQNGGWLHSLCVFFSRGMILGFQQETSHSASRHAIYTWPPRLAMYDVFENKNIQEFSRRLVTISKSNEKRHENSETIWCWFLWLNPKHLQR